MVQGTLYAVPNMLQEVQKKYAWPIGRGSSAMALFVACR